VLIRRENRGGCPVSAKFPVNFPVSREFAAETGTKFVTLFDADVFSHFTHTGVVAGK
jgi:hypothetical protein